MMPLCRTFATAAVAALVTLAGALAQAQPPIRGVRPMRPPVSVQGQRPTVAEQGPQLLRPPAVVDGQRPTVMEGPPPPLTQSARAQTAQRLLGVAATPALSAPVQFRIGGQASAALGGGMQIISPDRLDLFDAATARAIMPARDAHSYVSFYLPTGQTGPWLFDCAAFPTNYYGHRQDGPITWEAANSGVPPTPAQAQNGRLLFVANVTQATPFVRIYRGRNEYWTFYSCEASRIQ